MPYIGQARRAEIDAGDVPRTSGELAYRLSAEIARYLEAVREHDGGVRFEHLSDVAGAMHSTDAEFRARVLEPYEAAKLVQNGQVYDLAHLVGGEREA